MKAETFDNKNQKRLVLFKNKESTLKCCSQAQLQVAKEIKFGRNPYFLID